MNERFEKLAEQAGLKSEIMLDDSSREVECFVAQYDECIPSIHYWEKFAELIVRECIECADMVGKNNLASGYPNSTAHHVKQKIKEHFGVKE